MKALNFIAFCAWVVGFAGTMDLSGEFQPAAIAIGAAGLAVNAVTARKKGNHRKEKP